MGYTRRSELRKISPAELNKIALILNSQLAWKRLMENVPSELTDAESVNRAAANESPRYGSDDIALIESTRHHKMSSEIFLEEWATSGRIRPTLGHLLQILVDIQLFRAADYVATLLNEPPPTRPDRGPAARVDIDLDLLENNNSLSQQLLSMNNPGTSQLMNRNTGPNNNIDFFNKQNLDNVVKVDAREIPSTSTRRNNIPLPSVELSQPSTSARRNIIPSTSTGVNPIPSTSARYNSIPSTSARLNHFPSTTPRLNNIQSTSSEESNRSVCVPDLDLLIFNQADQSDQNLTSTMSSFQSDRQFPNLSVFRHDSQPSDIRIIQHSNYSESEDDLTSTSSVTNSSRATPNIPNISQLNVQEGEYDSSLEQEFSANLPDISAFIVQPLEEQ